MRVYFCQNFAKRSKQNIPTSFSLSLIKNDFNDKKPVQNAGTFQALIYMFGTLDLT